jgi:hypothetical protein
MLGGRGARGGVTLLLLMAVAGCGAPAPSAPLAPSVSASAQPAPTSPPLGVDNWTTEPLTLVVNGVPLEVIRGTEWPVKAPLPPLPWDVEARSPSGRALATLHVASDHPDISTRVDLACGRIDIFTITPLLGPAAVGSFPPCD